MKSGHDRGGGWQGLKFGRLVWLALRPTPKSKLIPVVLWRDFNRRVGVNGGVRGSADAGSGGVAVGALAAVDPDARLFVRLSRE